MKSQLAVVLIGLLPALCVAEPFDNLQIDNATCNLVKSGTGNRDVLFSGEAAIGKCLVTIPVATFSQSYSFCALSGVLAPKGNVGCEFSYYDEGHKNVSFIGNKNNVCEFVCIRKWGKGLTTRSRVDGLQPRP